MKKSRSLLDGSSLLDTSLSYVITLAPWLVRFVVSQNRHLLQSCADPECFVREGPTQLFFSRGREGPNTTKSGPIVGPQFRWRADDGPSWNAGLVAL